MTQATEKELVQQSGRRAKYLTGLMWHVGVYVIINTFMVFLDLLGEGGINWSIWIIVFWGFALAFHALAYFVDGRNVESDKAREYVGQERDRLNTPS